jgi:DNA mismatch endonuclease (patch repair protein)
MADVFTPEKRSEIMSRVKGRGNRATELRLMNMFRSHGIKGWRRNVSLYGKPDFIFPESRMAVFVDGCFWHGCPIHGSIPESNRAFWKKKIARNKKRDRVVKKKLDELGWKTLRIWQHEFRKPDTLVDRLKKFLQPKATIRSVRKRLGSLRTHAILKSQF